jgi:hypothetical protein
LSGRAVTRIDRQRYPINPQNLVAEYQLRLELKSDFALMPDSQNDSLTPMTR